jgi:hypothetical protein
MNVHPFSLKEFIEKSSTGDICPSTPILSRNMSGDQFHEMTFEQCGKKLCEKHGIDPIKLYHAIQQSINSEMIQRLNRSKVFRDRVNLVVCDEWGNCSISDMFSNNLDEPYDQVEFNRQSHESQEIRKMLEKYRGDTISDREPLVDLQNRCNHCLGRVRQGRIKLNEDYERYDPNHIDAWKSLAMKNYPYYLQSVKQSDDLQHQIFAEKQLKRAIPENIHKVFMNGAMLPTLMRKENRNLSNRLSETEGELSEDLQKLKYLIDSIPETPESDTGNNFLEGVLKKFGISVVDSSDEEQPDDSDEGPQKVIEMMRDVVEDDSHTPPDVSKETEDGATGDEETEDEETDDEDGGVGQHGGGYRKNPVYHLSFF